MKKLFLITVVASSILAGCSSTPTDTYEKRAQNLRERQQAAAEQAVDRAPKWMTELPKSDSAVYENGTAVSFDMAMATNKAKTMAFGKICMAAGGRVDQQSKLFRTETTDVGGELSEMAIKTFCPGVSIAGTEVVETKLAAENGKFRSYVLIAMPVGEANQVVKALEARDLRRNARSESDRAFHEMEQNRDAQ